MAGGVYMFTWMSTGSSRFLPQSKDTELGPTGDSELPTGVNLSVNVSLYMCVDYVIDWQPVHASRPMHAGMDSSPPATPSAV